MSEYKVNGESTTDSTRYTDPAGYDSVEESKNLVTRNTQLIHGEEEKGFNAQQHLKVAIDGILRIVSEYKENGKPLDNVARIKAKNNKELKKSISKDDEPVQ